ncbi:MAG: Cof-type HAD-IIB family hydrolase [Clostridia bacterium]|nr:Cof-type HAD-IIB family hydrolase [Clostridia bacterium]
MKKFEGMLFCTDLDGTLYSDDRTVSKQNLDAIEYFKSEGGLFTFITGRVPLTAASICDTIKPNAPYGCLNGGGIFDPAKNEYLWKMVLPDEFTEIIRDIDEQMPEVGIHYNAPYQIYFLNDNIVWDFFRKITGVEGVKCRFGDVKEPVMKVVFGTHEESTMQKLIAFLKEHPRSKDFDFIRSEQMLYELLPKGASKGNALYKMAELFSIDKKRTVAVGDYNNDISMIKAAGLGFAVSNAVPELKAASDLETVSNNEHAIAAIIDGLDTGKYEIF